MVLINPLMASLVEALPGNFIVLTADLQVVQVSNEYGRLLGLNKEKLLGKRLPEALPLGWESYISQLQEVARETQFTRKVVSRLVVGHIISQEYITGKPYTWQISCTPVDHGDETNLLIHTIMEVKEPLSKDSEHYRLLEDSGHIIVWDWERDKQLTWRSNGFFRMLAIPQVHDQAADPKLWASLLHPEDKKEVLASISKAFNHQTPEWQAEYRLRHDSGSYLTVADRARIIYNSQGEAIRMVGTTIDVTVQRIKELEGEKLNQLLRAVPGIVWSSDAEGNVMFVSEQYQKLTGRSIEQVKQGAWKEFIHPEDSQNLVSLWNNSRELKKMGSAEFRLKLKNCPDYRWFIGCCVPVMNEEGLVTSLVGLSTDIHEQKMASLTSHAQEEKLRKMLDALPVMAWAAAPDGTYTYYNKRWWDFFATSTKSWTLEQWGELMHPQDQVQTVQRWNYSLATEVPYDMRLRWKAHHKADYRWFHATAIPVRDSAGKVEYWMGVTTDIHEQVVLQQGLEDENTAFRFLADVMPHMVWRTNAKGFYNYFNQRWVEYTGYDVKSSLGTEMWNNLLHPEDQVRAHQVWAYSLLTGEPYEIEYRFKRASDGVWRWFLGRALPLRNSEGEILQWYGTFTDIEDKKRTEDLLQQQKTELELINQDLDHFVHMVGHDLKLPLVNMGSLFEALIEENSFDTPNTEFLIQHFKRSHRIMTTTLNDLLELAQLQQSSLVAVSEVSLQEIINEVLESLGELITSSNAEITLELDSDDQLLFQRVSLRSMLHNLISNAIKYRHPDRKPEVTISSHWEDDFLILAVKDNGLGIDLGRQEKKLFGAFSRLHGHIEGSGLGLYIVKRVVDAVKGEVRVVSEPGEGSVFYVRFQAKG